MTNSPRITSRSRESIDQTGVLRWKNVSGETIPAFACVRLSAYNATDRYYNAVKPDGDGSLHFFNGAADIAVNKFGESSIWGRSSVLGLTPGTFGETVGPTDGSWEMTPDGTGFTVFSNVSEGGVAAILRDGGGGTGSAHIWFEIDEVVCAEDGTMSLVASPTDFTGGCNAPIPGLDSYGFVPIEDPCEILSFYTAEWLVGKRGRATYMFPVGEGSYCEGRWLVDVICGQPDCA